MSNPFPIDIPPGVVKGESLLASAGRFTQANNVRWVRGRPEKIGGFEALTGTPLSGPARGMTAWGDNTGRQQFIGAGTAAELYSISNQSLLPVVITPYVTTATLVNPFGTTNGSAEVTVTMTAHGAAAGQTANFSGATAVAGLTLAGDYEIIDVPSVNSFVVNAGSNASSTTTGGGTVTIGILLAAGNDDISTGFGFGVGEYGMEAYSTPRAASSVIFYPRSWALDSFGKLLLANPVDGPIFKWDATEAPVPRATTVSGAPTIAAGLFVTSERTVFALGTNSISAQDKMQFHTSGQGTFDDWDYAATASTAGGRPSIVRRLQIGTRIIAGVDLGQQLNLIWTDAALYINQFVNNQFVYQTRLAGRDCGLIGPRAFVTVAGVAYWAGNDSFFMFNGNVQKIPNSSDVSEWLFKRVRPFYTVKTVAWHNARYGEIWFAFCVDNDTEPTLAAVYNLEGRFWFTCEISRTAGTTFEGFDTRPILAGPDGILYRHDTGVDANGSALPWELETAVLEIENGRTIYTVYGVALDMERQTGNVNITMTGYDRSNASAQVIDEQTESAGPADGIVDFRVNARLMKMRLAGSGVGSDFRMGIPKVEITPSARRR